MKKLYLFTLMLLAAFAASATTLTGAVYRYDYDAETWTDVGEVQADVSISLGTVSFSNFLGSNLSLDVTCKSDGTATHNRSANYYSGPFTIGDAGTYQKVYLYAGGYGYDDFEYYVSNAGNKYLSFGATFDNDYFAIDFELPSDFKAVDQYTSRDVSVFVINGGNIESTLIQHVYIDDEGNVSLPGLFGASAFNYSIKTDGSIKTLAESNWIKSDGFVVDSIANNYLYTYGDKYLTYDAAANTITDYVHFYESNAGRYFRVNLNGVAFSTSVCKWDFATKTGTYADRNIEVNAEIDGNAITLSNFLGSGQTFVVKVYSDATAEHNFISGTYQNGPYNFGSCGSYPAIYLYAGSWNYNDFSYYVDTTGAKYLHFGVYAYKADWSYDWYDLYVALPDDFTPAETKDNAKIYSVVDDKESSELYSTYLTTTVSGSTVTVKNPFGTTGFSFPFTMQTDGSVASTYEVGGYFTKSYTLNGKKYARLYDIARSFDTRKKVFKWTIGMATSTSITAENSDIYNVYLTLPSDLEPTVPQVYATYSSVLYTTNAQGTNLPLSTFDAKLNITELDSCKVAIETALGKSVSLNVSWDAEGAVTVDGSFKKQWYYFNSDYYQNITIDASKSKYVDNRGDKYLELSLTTTTGYNGGVAFTDLPYRIYFERRSTDVSTISPTVYEYDAATEEYGDGAYAAHAYSITGGRLSISEILESNKDLTIRFYTSVDSAGNGKVTTGLAAGTYEGTFVALGKTYSKLVYAGDDNDAYWYVDGRSKYFRMYVTLDEQEYEIELKVPSEVTFFEDPGEISMDVYDWTNKKYNTSGTFKVPGYAEDSTVTLIDFGGSDLDVAFTVYEDEAIVTTVNGTTITQRNSNSPYKYNNDNLKGNFTFDSFNFTELQIYSIDYQVSNDDNTRNVELYGYGVQEDGTKLTTSIYVILPDSLTLKEYEKNVEVFDVVDGEEAAEGSKLHWDVTVKGSTVTIKNPFNATRSLSFPFTMLTDGRVSSTFAVGGYFTAPYTYNGFSYGRLKDNKREYLADTKQFKWSVTLCQVRTLEDNTVEEYDPEDFVVYVQLPEDFEPAVPTITLYVYEWDTEKDDFGEGEDTYTNEYALNDDGTITLKNFLGSDLSFTIQLYEAPEGEDGEATTDLTAGTHAGSFTAFNKTYTSLSYDGDEEAACWYIDDYNYNYFEIDLTLGNEPVVVEFEIPDGAIYAQSTTSGVSNVAVDNISGKVEYYNLQGMRVNNPSTGIYIRKNGDKISKVLIK